MSDDTAVAVFEAHRPVLTGVAYRMLGRFADAEDVVQETWLRWDGADRAAVREPRAFLVRTTTRLAIDRLRHVQSRRESYVGEWLPEPLTTDGPSAAADAEERVLLAETVSFAMLVLLESLSPLERAVFVLREAFGYPYAEIAAVLDRGEPAVRQLAGRARRHVEERQPRYDADPVVGAEVTERFLAACVGGDLEGLMALLAPDVRLMGDGGGVQKAPLRVIETASKVGRFLHAISSDTPPDAAVTFREVNGAPAIVITTHGRPHTVVALETRDGRIACVYLLTNPGKLTGIR
ncbi:RNA polymerase sigma-70 factor [Streptomyces sp. NPDC051976]|uniref:RNA polymerase sigma-70 factor n=1 Tax=Streptomyces sp. NPDC051976 TaxID=3154947 RepID=UPI00342959D3